jgi:hypothetical protein
MRLSIARAAGGAHLVQSIASVAAIAADDHALARRRLVVVFLVFAARRAAAFRTCGPFVFAARLAASLLARGERRFAAVRACRDKAFFDTTDRLSPFNAFTAARERFGDGRFRPRLAARVAEAALCFVRFVALAGGAGSFTPARRAFDKPIAIACFVDRAPCFPSRMCSISSWTNSPAWVVGAFPSRFAFRARSRVSCSGMMSTPPLQIEATFVPVDCCICASVICCDET